MGFTKSQMLILMLQLVFADFLRASTLFVNTSWLGLSTLPYTKQDGPTHPPYTIHKTKLCCVRCESGLTPMCQDFRKTFEPLNLIQHEEPQILLRVKCLEHFGIMFIRKWNSSYKDCALSKTFDIYFLGIQYCLDWN